MFEPSFLSLSLGSLDLEARQQQYGNVPVMQVVYIMMPPEIVSLLFYSPF